MLREFTDHKGTKWRVFDVYPQASPPGVQSASSREASRAERVLAFPSRDHAEGWLCFESEAEKRRLTPIPPEWEICDPSKLEELCGCAGFVSRMSPSPAGTQSQKPRT